MHCFHKILDFEAGDLTDGEIVLMFQELVDSGDIWKLPAEYTTTAASLIQRGILKSEPKRVN